MFIEEHINFSKLDGQDMMMAIWHLLLNYELKACLLRLIICGSILLPSI
ncbi:hypothetical protein X798_02850 [Onchocerca flexuosa]|uniref:Uncharacterized protein n=1 Tax=Onchocerca flexuosa TaxID=387005 RepID=A0A238BY70_9BILA|nr:hypothetical protein X798_02850 [Onchocerca flexuosa]